MLSVTNHSQKRWVTRSVGLASFCALLPCSSCAVIDVATGIVIQNFIQNSGEAVQKGKHTLVSVHDFQ